MLSVGPYVPAPLQDLLDIYSHADTRQNAESHSGKSPMMRAPETVVLHETATWSQNYPYNEQCPNKAPTGCNNTAMAIAMRYHCWPPKGAGITQEYKATGVNAMVPARNLEHPYRWDKMPVSPDKNYKYSQEEVDELATLMADIGAANRTSYSPSGSGTSPHLQAIVESFGYSAEFQKLPNNFDHTTWSGILQDQINNIGPILYEIYLTNRNEYHMVILDGYSTNGEFFHVNWGWGGQNNGFFRLDSFKDDKRMLQIAYINFKPDRDGISRYMNGLNGGFFRNPIFYGDPLEPIGLAFLLSPENPYPNDFTGEMQCGVTDSKGNVKFLYGTPVKVNIPAFSTGAASFNIVLERAPERGDCIQFYYRSKDSDEWKTLCNYLGLPLYHMIADDSTIEESTSITYDSDSRFLVINTKQGVRLKVMTAEGNEAPDVKITAGEDVYEIWLSTLVQGKDYVINLTKNNEEVNIKFCYSNE